MADIRINSLPTTASASSSDDFLALDGAANGTRKLNAYSPTFGGNLTVSGTSLVNAPINVNAPALQVSSTDNDASGLYLKVRSSPGSANARNWAIWNNYNSAGNLDILRSTTNTGAPTTTAFSLDSSSNATLSGNLTVSGTGTSSVAGNFGIGTTSTSYKVDVNGSLVSTYTNNPALALLRSTDSQAANKGGGIYFGGVYSGTAQTEFAYIGGVKENGTAGNYAGKLVFGTRANGTGADDMTRMTLTATGNFLIGTTTDGGQKLQVNGDAAFAGDRVINRKDQNAVTRLQVRNDTSGTSGQAQIAATVGDFTTYTALGQLSAGFTSTGLYQANSGYFVGSNALYIFTASASSLVLGTNNTTALTLDSSQRVKTASTLNVGDGTSDSQFVNVFTNKVNNTSGPVTINLPADSSGVVTLYSAQSGIGKSMWQIPYINDGGTVQLGTAVKTIKTADPVSSAVAATGAITVSVVAANTYCYWGINCVKP